MKIRVGFGYDVHALVPGRELWLGGIRFEHELGLLGHSDADVLIHAVCDALLGAAWPVMHTEFGVSVSYMGMISIIISMAREISSESVKTLENSSPLPQFISSGTVLFFSK